MPYPLSDDRERLMDMLSPTERLLFQQLEDQMSLSRSILKAFRAAHYWAVICAFALAISILAWAMRC